MRNTGNIASKAGMMIMLAVSLCLMALSLAACHSKEHDHEHEHHHEHHHEHEHEGGLKEQLIKIAVTVVLLIGAVLIERNCN